MDNGPTLRQYVEALFDAHKEAHAAHEVAHGREHDFAQKAIDKAAELSATNKADANEWRSAMNDRERTFSTKVELKAVTDKADRLDDADIRRQESERLQERAQQRQQWLFGFGVLIASVVVNLLLRLLTA